MSRRDRREARLHAWQDGELAGLSARRAARRVERSEEARRELEQVRVVGSWVRDSLAADDGPEPDLWSGIAARLAAQREANVPRSRPWLGRPLMATAAVAAAAAALVVGLLLEPAAKAGGVVQWLDSEGAPVMVFDGPGDTIIWMLNPAQEEISGSARRVAA